MLCNHLRYLIPFYNSLQCSLSLLNFSDAFRPFATFLDFALFNTPPFRLFSYYIGLIGLALCQHFMFHSIITAVLMFLVTTTTKENREFPLRLYYSVLTSDLVVPLIVLILAHISCISHRLLSPILELCCTISTDLALT